MIKLHIVDPKLYFVIDQFHGFLSRFVIELPGVPKIIGINPVYVFNKNKTPGIGILIALIHTFGSNCNIFSAGEIPKGFDQKIKNTLTFETNDEAYEILKEYAK